MKCRNCHEQMDAATVFDNPETDIAFNLYLCPACGWICKEDVWSGKGQLWIDTSNDVTKVHPC